MKIHQLFKDKISEDILLKVILAFGLKSINDETAFSKEDLINHNTVLYMNELKDILLQYYLPCKAKIYLENLDESKCVTVLRQLLKLFQIKLISKQKYIHNKKCTIYFIKKSLEAEHHTIRVVEFHDQVVFN
jgi:hypothetical protein